MPGAAQCLENFRARSPQEEEGNRDRLLNTRLALTYLALGDLTAAERCFPASPTPSLNPSLTRPPEPDHDSEPTETQFSQLLPALLQITHGAYPAAVALLQELPQTDLVVQNLAVCLFYMGRKDESIALLEGLVRGSRDGEGDGEGGEEEGEERDGEGKEGGNGEGKRKRARGFYALTFNLATCYELGGGAGEAKKVELAGRVVEGLGERDRAWFKL